LQRKFDAAGLLTDEGRIVDDGKNYRHQGWHLKGMEYFVDLS